jgi:hypothetical protein
MLDSLQVMSESLCRLTTRLSRNAAAFGQVHGFIAKAYSEKGIAVKVGILKTHASSA